jgi:hypothetical protein
MENSDQTYIKIKGVPKNIKEDLTNISKNLGISLTSMLKPKLREIANSYPPELKRKFKD